MTPQQRLALALAILGGGSAIVGGTILTSTVGAGEHAIVCMAQEAVDGGIVQGDADVCTLMLQPDAAACELLLQNGGDNLTAYPPDVAAAALGRQLMTLQHEGALMSWHATAQDAGACSLAVWMTREQARAFAALQQADGGALFAVTQSVVDAGPIPTIAGQSGVPDSFVLTAP